GNRLYNLIASTNPIRFNKNAISRISFRWHFCLQTTLLVYMFWSSLYYRFTVTVKICRFENFDCSEFTSFKVVFASINKNFIVNIRGIKLCSSHKVIPFLTIDYTTKGLPYFFLIQFP